MSISPLPPLSPSNPYVQPGAEGGGAVEAGGSDDDSSLDDVLPRKVGRREADLQARRQKYAALRVAEAKAREAAAHEKAVQLKVRATSCSFSLCAHVPSLPCASEVR